MKFPNLSYESTITFEGEKKGPQSILNFTLFRCFVKCVSKLPACMSVRKKANRILQMRSLLTCRKRDLSETEGVCERDGGRGKKEGRKEGRKREGRKREGRKEGREGERETRRERVRVCVRKLGDCERSIKNA